MTHEDDVNSLLAVMHDREYLPGGRLLGKAPEATSDYDPAELLLVVHGATMPNQREARLLPGSSQESQFMTHGIAINRAVVVEQAGEFPAGYSLGDPGFYPRNRAFMVHTCTDIGTIDQLVTAYRRRLIAARQAVGNNDVALINGYGCPENQVKLRELQAKYRVPDLDIGAVPWDYDGLVGRIQQEQERLSRIVPTAMLPITTAQWIWLGMHRPAAAQVLLNYGISKMRIVAQDGHRIKLKWDVIFEEQDNCSDFDREREGTELCLILDTPNPWTDDKFFRQ